MSRRKVQWLRRIVKVAGNVDKLIPGLVKGEGKYLTKSKLDNVEDFDPPKPGTGEGHVVSRPMGSRKEALIRKWAKV
jgi:hypothetical protein